jgi:hypothetical protein
MFCKNSFFKTFHEKISRTQIERWSSSGTQNSFHVTKTNLYNVHVDRRLQVICFDVFNVFFPPVINFALYVCICCEQTHSDCSDCSFSFVLFPCDQDQLVQCTRRPIFAGLNCDSHSVDDGYDGFVIVMVLLLMMIDISVTKF